MKSRDVAFLLANVGVFEKLIALHLKPDLLVVMGLHSHLLQKSVLPTFMDIYLVKDLVRGNRTKSPRFLPLLSESHKQGCITEFSALQFGGEATDHMWLFLQILFQSP